MNRPSHLLPPRTGGGILLAWGLPLLLSASAAPTAPIFEGRDHPSIHAAEAPDAAGVLVELHGQAQLDIQLGRLAREKGATLAVRAFGRRLEDDHRLAQRLVLELARERGLALVAAGPAPGGPEPRREDAGGVLQWLHSIDGLEFDQAYLRTVATGLQRAIARMMWVSALVEDVAVRRLVERLVPILGQQHSLANNLEARLTAAQALAAPGRGGG